MTALFLLALAASAGRGDLEATAGGGVWIPTGAGFETALTAGPALELGLLIPMELDHCIWLRGGYRSAGSDSSAWSGAGCIPLQIGYRVYPFYQRYAGARGLEPFAGLGAGGFVAWDEPGGAGPDAVTTGGGMISLELGARVRLGGETWLDFMVRPEYMPAGRELAGEDDLSGLTVAASVSF